MSIDIGGIVEAAAGAAAKAVKDVAPQVEDFLRELAKGHEAALATLAEALAKGDIDEDTFRSEIGDEGKTLEAELQAVAVLSKAIAQRAVNAFGKALVDGITAAVKAAI